MKKPNFFFAIILLLLLVIGCENQPEQQSFNESEPQGESYRHTIPGYLWLHRYANSLEENYQDSLDYYFNKSIAENDHDMVAIYLIAQGTVLDSAMEYDSLFYARASTLVTNNGDEISRDSYTNLCYYLGSQSFLNNEVTTSIEWFKKAIKPAPTNQSHKQMQGFSNFSLAQSYYSQNKLELTEEHLINALDIFADIGDITNQGTVYLLLHNVFLKSSAYEEAEEHLEKALKIFKENDNKGLTYNTYTLYVNMYMNRTDTIQAIKYMDSMAYMVPSFTLNRYDEAILTQFLAFKHSYEGDIEQAKEYLTKARDITENMQSTDLHMRTLFQEIMFAKIFKKPLENPEEIESFYLELSKQEKPTRQYLIQLGSALFDYYSNKGEYDKAITYAELLINDKRQDMEERLKGRLYELQQKFETEQKEKKILQQEKLLEAQKKTIFFLGGGAIFIILTFTIIIIWNKNKSILREKALTESFTSQLLSRTEDERKRIASDLHDSVSNELINLRHALEEKSAQIKSKIDSILEEVRNISRNLSPTLFDKLGLKDSIEQLTERAQNQHSFMLTSEVEYSGSLRTSVELQLYRIIQEATTNIIKHANAMAGKITITEDADYVYVEVKDNGKGFDVEKMLEKGNCFGLLNITERAKFIDGTVNFKSGDKGTTVQIKVPK